MGESLLTPTFKHQEQAVLQYKYILAKSFILYRLHTFKYSILGAMQEIKDLDFHKSLNYFCISIKGSV